MIRKILAFSFLFTLILWPFSAKADYCAGGNNCEGLLKTQCEQADGCDWLVGGAIKEPASPGTVSLDNPLGNISTPQLLIGKVINSILGLVGSLALLMFIYGGLIWMTASGSQEKIKKGRNILVWSTIGLVVVFSSYGILRFILASLGAS